MAFCRAVLSAVVLVRAAAAQTDLRVLDQSFTLLSEKIAPAVVQVLSDAYTPLTESPTGPSAFEQSTASGIILSRDGYVVTNAHVVKGATRVTVILNATQAEPQRGSSILRPRGKRLSARLVGLDRETDIAVLKVEAQNLPALTLGDSDRVRQGQLVLAFGSPFGLQNSVSMGIVSAVARQLEADDPMIYIQSDVRINPGNSGGPMVDVTGNVIGVNTMIISDSGLGEGVGLAVPSNIVKTVTEQIIKQGFVRRGEIGIEPQTITEPMAEALALERPLGVILGDVRPGSSAAMAGLEIGDIVLSLNGKAMENARQLQVNLYSVPVDSLVEVEVLRKGRTFRRRVKVTELPNDPDRFAALVNREVATIPQIGVMGLQIDTKVRDMLPATRRPRGILVANVIASAGRPAGVLENGDIIYTVNRTPVTTLDEIKGALAHTKPGDTVVLQVERAEKLRYVELTVD